MAVNSFIRFQGWGPTSAFSGFSWATRIKMVLGSYTEGRGAGGKPWNGSNQPTYSSPRRGGGSGTDRAERVTGGAGAIRPDQLVA